MSNIESFSFSNTSNGVTTTLTFQGRTEGTTAFTFQDMCKRAAQAFGYGESSIEEVFGESSDDSFMEFYEEDED